MLSWRKSDNIQYSKYFNLREFNCQCSLPTCDQQLISTELLKKLETVRTLYNRQIKVTSGYRCKAHQEALAAAGLETATNSQHCLGLAADIWGPDMDALDALCSQEFKAVGRARSFIHVDMREDKRRRWGYVKS